MSINGGHHIVKMSLLPKSILIFNAVPTTTTTVVTGRSRNKNNLKIPMESQETMNNNLKKRTK